MPPASPIPKKPTLRAAAESREPLFIGDHRHCGLLVFLDFDGVLHPLGPGQIRFSNAPILLRALRAIQEQLHQLVNLLRRIHLIPIQRDHQVVQFVGIGFLR